MKGSEIRLVSKYPLARYRPEFDQRTKRRHKLKLDEDILDVVRLTLATIDINRYQDDWVEHPGAALSCLQFRMTFFKNADDMKSDETEVDSSEQQTSLQDKNESVDGEHLSHFSKPRADKS